MPTPTSRQRIMASGLPLRAWHVTGQAIGLSILFLSVRPALDSWAAPWFWVWAIGCIAMTMALSFLVSGVISLFVFGPMLYSQELANGGPFAEGDRVMVLSGTHAGRETEVYCCWPNGGVRVRLGADDEANYSDVFTGAQLLRLPGNSDE